MIGIDPYVGNEDNYKLSLDTIEHLGNYSFQFLSQVCNPAVGLSDTNYWHHSKDFGMREGCLLIGFIYQRID